MAMPSPSSLQPAHDDEETISYHVISESQITQDHLDACVELCSVSLAYYGEVVENGMSIAFFPRTRTPKELPRT